MSSCASPPTHNGASANSRPKAGPPPSGATSRRSPGTAVMARAPREKRAPPTRLSSRQLTALLEEAIIDAYDESEQRVGFLTMLEEHLACRLPRQSLAHPYRSNAW